MNHYRVVHDKLTARHDHWYTVTLGWFLRSVGCPRVYKWSLDGSILLGQTNSWLEISLLLALVLFPCILWNVQLERTSSDTLAVFFLI